MKVAYFQHQRSGCYWYRIKQKMDALQKAGIDTAEIKLEQDIDDDIQSIQLYGAYPYSLEKVLQAIKGTIKIIYDMDDALHLVTPDNPFYYGVKKDLNSVTEILRYADEVTVSTPKMAEYAATLYSGKITILPNTYNPQEWDYPRVKREGIRIGFAGGAPHVSDLLEVIPAIRELQDTCNVKFLIMGFGETDYRTWYKHYRYIASDEALKDLLDLDKLLADIVFEWVPFVDFTIYPQVLNNMALDIGICPLKDTPFNQCRSAIKAMEYNLSGAIALASNVGAYADEPTSTLVHRKEWLTELQSIIMNKDKYKETQQLQLQWLKDNREISTQIELLKSIYVVV